MERSQEIKTFTPSTVGLLLCIAIGAGVALYRMIHGLGHPVTGLNDVYPWGFWLGFDVLGGVAMAAGGFIIACAVYIFNWKKYRPITRPAILTAFLGYLMAVVAIFFDIGHPFRLYHPGIMWQYGSVMWIVAMHVMFYTTTLAIESSPMLFEKLRWERARVLVDKILVGAVIFGVMLSTLHQASLGAVFLIAPPRMSPLWYTQFIPYLFLISAVAMGLAMVSAEAYLSSKAFHHEVDPEIFYGLARGMAVTLAIYLGCKLYFLFTNAGLAAAFDGSLAANMYLLEMGIGVILPLALLAVPAVRRSARRIFTVNIIVISGILLNRINVCVISMEGYTIPRGGSYLPSVLELLMSLGIVCLGVFLFKMAAKHLPLFAHAEH
ncbi:MAG: NrfD/PsrC family molybdoenzyme membrane anchor subunit [Thermodesulfobacteriota bacterium]